MTVKNSKKAARDLHQYVDIVAKVRIEHDMYREILDELVYAYESVGHAATPICLLLTGDTRTGKSCVVHNMLELCLPARADRKGVQTILYAVVPAKATVKSLLEALLKGLGDPFWSRGTESSMTQRLYTMLDAVQCKMIILDEFQHICDKGQAKKLDVLADWLKVLIESKKYGLVAVGLPVAASVINEHKQLVGRFDAALRMPLFDWRDRASRLQFRGLLRQFQRDLSPFEMPTLDDEEMALRMYLATAGRIGVVAKLLDRTIKNAIRAGALQIRLEDFAKAYERAIWAADRFPVPGGPFGAQLARLNQDTVRASVLNNAAMESVADESAAVSVHGVAGVTSGARGTSGGRTQKRGESPSGRRRISEREKAKRDLGRAL